MAHTGALPGGPEALCLKHDARKEAKKERLVWKIGYITLLTRPERGASETS